MGETKKIEDWLFVAILLGGVLIPLVGFAASFWVRTKDTKQGNIILWTSIGAFVCWTVL